MKYIVVLLALLFVGCDPNVRTARVKPNKSIDLQLTESFRTTADVYFSKDRQVELQVFDSSGMGRPGLSAFLLNRRSSPIKVDLSLAYVGEARGKPCSIWFAGCNGDKSKTAKCKSSVLELLPLQSKEIHLGCSAQGEFHLPVPSLADTTDEIIVRFKLCQVGGIGRSCESVR